MEWNEETIAQLRTLWEEGHSTAQIGRRLNTTKNAVVGKAHRLRLAARPSPINLGQSRTKITELVHTQSANKASLSSFVVKMEVSNSFANISNNNSVKPKNDVVSVDSHKRVCCWPLGEPGTKSFRFCDVVVEAGKPYCPEHVSIAYVKVRERRISAA